MTRKDFVLIARIIRELRPLFRAEQIKNIINVFAANFCKQFPRFNRDKFERFILKD